MTGEWPRFAAAIAGGMAASSERWPWEIDRATAAICQITDALDAEWQKRQLGETPKQSFVPKLEAAQDALWAQIAEDMVRREERERVLDAVYQWLESSGLQNAFRVSRQHGRFDPLLEKP